MGVTLTDGELKVLQLAWQCFTQDPKVDYEKLASLGGWKNKNTAAAIYSAAKKKMLAGSDAPAPKSAPKKRAAAGDAGVPKKRGRKARTESAVVNTEGDDEEEDVKVKKEERRDSMEDLLEGAEEFSTGEEVEGLGEDEV
ncbi:hypothetical protein DOTSEDRAFT_27864 [Dothistroma septosporum NZE10]|uniref:Uncharacterized protein n=1 Tax=Dothistroma septosporum (strain NZE10 / CBS 128990) TaxID=675120 RepID=N1PCX4_DOTSN|nr:hypothetical protein DOTSEDRAFT_27864 [Dothistroma septosporum NZE10]